MELTEYSKSINMATYDEEERRKQAQEASQKTESQLRAGDAAQAAQEESAELEGMQPKAPTPPAGAVNAGQSVSVSGGGTNVPKPSWREEPRNSWESYTSAWNRNNPLESNEDYEKRRRRTRASAIISSLGEGLSSMANLYYTTHYSPSAAPTNLSAGMLKRYNDMEAERAKNKEAWAKGYQQAKQLDETRDQWEKNWRRIRERDAKQDEMNEREQARKDELHPFQVATASEGVEQAKHQTTILGEKAKNAGENERVDLEGKKSKLATEAAQRSHINAQTNEIRSGRANDSSKPKSVNRFLETDYETEEEMRAAMIQASSLMGVDRQKTVKNPTTGLDERKDKSWAELRSELEQKYMEDVEGWNKVFDKSWYTKNRNPLNGNYYYGQPRPNRGSMLQRNRN